MEFVAFLGEDVQSWGQITGLINRGEWEKVILIKNKLAPEYESPKEAEMILLDCSKPLIELKNELVAALKPKFSGFDANLSLASGNGKEHMALISALLSIPVGIRLVAFTKNGIEWIN